MLGTHNGLIQFSYLFILGWILLSIPILYGYINRTLYTNQLQNTLMAVIKYMPKNVAMAVCRGDSMEYLYYSDSMVEMYDLPLRDYKGVSHYEVFPGIRPEWRADHQAALWEGRSAYQYTPEWFTAPNGERKAIIWGISVTKDFTNAANHLVIMVWLDVTPQTLISDENRQLNIELKELAFNDALTGLHNRSYFEHQLDSIYKFRTTKYVVVVIMDLDGFKPVNDGHGGHDAGDVVLAEVGKRIKAVVRKEDLASRWGGDEFVFVLVNQSEAEAVKLCTRIAEVIKQPFFTDYGCFHVGCSFGIAGESVNADS